MKDNRPVNLDISTIRLPVTAIVSILTRISGVALFAAAALMLWLLDLSLAGEAGFREARELLAQPLARLVLWGILTVTIYHALAGVRHLVADFGYGETLRGGVFGARLVLVLAVLLSALAGAWLW